LNLFYYHFFNGLNETGGHFESLYSFFNIVSMLLPLVLQWRIVPLLTNKVETKNAFIALPATLALGMGLSMLLPGALPIAIGLLLSTSVASSWDNPMLNTLQNLIPEERRARVSTLLSNYSYAAGQIVGSLLLLSVFTLAPVLSLANSSLYLPLGFLAALGAVFAAVMVRRTYLDSMISWRVARRQRSASVLDKLDF
jgi:MFS family permease